MKAIRLNAVITSLRSKVDRSLGLNIATPELSTSEKAELMNLQGVNLELFIKPIDEAPKEILKVDTDLNTKSQSQRLRNVLYVLHKQNRLEDEFELFYKHSMNSIIEKLKDKIE